MTSSSLEKRGAARSPYLLDQLRWRHATKNFNPDRRIPAADWEKLEEALVFTPSSFGFQSWKVVVVLDPPLRRRLRRASMDQPQVTDASHLVVFAHRKDKEIGDVERSVGQIAEVRGVSEESLESYRQVMATFVDRGGRDLDVNVWSAHQLYIAVGNFLTSAAILKIDASPMEGIDAKQYDDILGLAREELHAVFVIAAGYGAHDAPEGR